MMRRTIVGIDPGTTAAIAVLDLAGNVLHVASFRVHDPAKIISEIIAVGKPIIIGCDRKDPPEAVAWFSRKLGCKLIAPPHDLGREEKKRLVREKTGNVHEFDALSAARFSHDHFRRLFMKIDRVLEMKEKEYLRDEVKEFLLKNEEINIDEALRLLEPREKIILHKQRRERKKDGFLELRTELAVQEERLRLLQSENKALLQRLDAPVAFKKKGRDLILREKEERIITLGKRVSSRERSLAEKEREILEWQGFIEGIGSRWIVVPRFKDLSSDSLNGRIRKDAEIIFVDAPDVMGARSLGYLSEVRIIISPSVPRDQDRFIFVQAKMLRVMEKGSFVLVRRDELDREVRAKDIFSKVLREYQEERTK
jgi:predicted RNase H-like nuclease (RuvC/YqgF family)